MPVSKVAEQLYKDLSKDLVVTMRIDGELFGKKYTRRPFRSLRQDDQDLNIYSEKRSRSETYDDPVNVPFRLQLNPSEDDLNKYGLEQKRDALAVFSRYLMESVFEVIPKIGDRFDHEYNEDNGTTRVEQYEIKEVKRTDYWRDSGEFLRYVVLASKATKAPVPVAVP